ncbi:hypothetical protein [Haladaptatus salinisoli]|uniref:hypothetical protein n=1 Tax=Haladaptatus salinisoli TaxID=2884876 RepID=UPI001D0B4998|nr:hypothetical protein [Haladaptatus salinisoli]
MSSNAKTGFVGGLFGTVIMTAFREPVARSLPPTAAFLSKFVGGEPDDHTVGALLLHLLYGAGAGSVFAPVLAARSTESSSLEPETEGLLAGLVYGLALSLFGERVLLEWLLEMNLEQDERAVFHAGHVVYGLSLGAWVGSRAE